MMKPFDDYKVEVLGLIWKYYSTPGSDSSFTRGDLDEVLGKDNVTGMAYMALDALCADEHVYRDTAYNQARYSITQQGIKFIEFLYFDCTSNGSLPDNESVGIPKAIPAADRLVTLDHNSDPYKEAISALDAVVEAFREDHLFENDWGIEKSVLLKTLESGRRLLEQTQAHAATLYTTVVTSLEVIREKYEHAMVAGLVTAAVDRVLPAVERAISSLLTLIGVF